MKIYFGGAIRGGREDKDLYRLIIGMLAEYGEVLTEHIGEKTLSEMGEKISESFIYQRDMAWLAEADVMVAEMTTPSLGVGYEARSAEEWGKPVLALYRPTEGRRLSAMIRGSGKIDVAEYQTLEELKPHLAAFFEKVKAKGYSR